MIKFQDLATNQNAGFWNFEIGAEINFQMKRMILWFQNWIPHLNQFFG